MNRDSKREKCKEWYWNNVEKRKEYNKSWREKNKEYNRERQKAYLNTKMGRAVSLVSKYKTEDRNNGRGECTLTAKWVSDNILSKPCAHCGESDWHKIGCNRLDNTKPHTKDNVEPCCFHCNTVEHSKETSISVDQISPVDGEVVKTWESLNKAQRNGYWKSNIRNCCNGKQTTHKGYLWKYVID